MRVAPNGKAVPTGRNVAKSPREATLPKEVKGATADPRAGIEVVAPNCPIKAADPGGISAGVDALPFGPTFFMTNSVDGVAFCAATSRLGVADLTLEKMTSGGAAAYLRLGRAAVASAANASALTTTVSAALGVVVMVEEEVVVLAGPTEDVVVFSPLITADTYSSTSPKNSKDFQSNIGSST